MADAGHGPVTFSNAGGFTYHCNVHPGMHGQVNVQMTVEPGSHIVGQPFSIFFASADAPSGFTEQIQKRKVGGTWRNLSVGNTGTSVQFTPPSARTFQFRARLALSTNTTNWSPILSVVVTAH